MSKSKDGLESDMERAIREALSPPKKPPVKAKSTLNPDNLNFVPTQFIRLIHLADGRIMTLEDICQLLKPDDQMRIQIPQIVADALMQAAESNCNQCGGKGIVVAIHKASGSKAVIPCPECLGKPSS